MGFPKESEKNIISEFLTKETFSQFRKYILTGGLSAAFEYGLFNLLTLFAGFWHVTSHAASMAAGFILSFLLNKYWSFRARYNFARQFLLTGLLFTINLFISSLVIYLLVEKLGIMEQLSKLGVMGMIVAWNFLLFKKVIYR